MRIMAIDYGQKRVGVAISDPFCVISQPFVTLKVRSQKELIKRLKFIIEKNDVGLVLIGNPLSHKGKSTRMSQEIGRFVKQLKKSLAVEIKLWDERFTSRYALRVLKERGVKQRKDKIDQVVASFILDEYLRSLSECSV